MSVESMKLTDYLSIFSQDVSTLIQDLLRKNALIELNFKILIARRKVSKMLCACANIANDLVVDDLGEYLSKLRVYRIGREFIVLFASIDEDVVRRETP